MVRRLAVVIALATSLVIARGASALPITPVDFDSWMGGSIVRSHTGLFTSVFDPTTTTGEISTDVLFDGLEYTVRAPGDAPRRPLLTERFSPLQDGSTGN